MNQISLEEAKIHLKELVDAALKGEEILIAKDQEHIVKLTPVSAIKSHTQFGSAKGQIWMADDFDSPIEDFAEYEK